MHDLCFFGKTAILLRYNAVQLKMT